MKVEKYRSVSNEVEAINYASEDHRKAIIEWSDCRHSGIDDDGADFETLLLFLPDNRGGEIRLYPGEWAVKNADGRFFALSDAEFLKGYRPISETPQMVLLPSELTDDAYEAMRNAMWSAETSDIFSPTREQCKAGYAALIAAKPINHAITDIAAERRRQIEEENFSFKNDDLYTDGELADAAACYIASFDKLPSGSRQALWPWLEDWWKSTTYRRDLVKAGALIAAEIERLDRAALAESKDDD